MFDIASSSAGATISVATSHDDENAPENIIDGWDTFKSNVVNVSVRVK